ncbi:MAG: hypothetical protein ACR2PH_07205, partial [Desulfobulbia bacterium]
LIIGLPTILGEVWRPFKHEPIASTFEDSNFDDVLKYNPAFKFQLILRTRIAPIGVGKTTFRR